MSQVKVKWIHANNCLTIGKRYLTENVYDEPSQPDPIYQEIVTNTAPKIQMVENDSYIIATREPVTVLQECVAYIRHNDLHQLQCQDIV